jgi:hypothetical protein
MFVRSKIEIELPALVSARRKTGSTRTLRGGIGNRACCCRIVSLKRSAAVTSLRFQPFGWSLLPNKAAPQAGLYESTWSCLPSAPPCQKGLK